MHGKIIYSTEFLDHRKDRSRGLLYALSYISGRGKEVKAYERHERGDRDARSTRSVNVTREFCEFFESPSTLTHPH